MAKKKTKYIKPLMRYNPGFQRMEPDLPSLPEAKEIKHKNFAWIYLIISLLILIGGLILVYYFG